MSDKESMAIILVDKPISRQELREIGEPQFGGYVKAVVDINKAIMAVGGDFHADEEAFLLQHGSNQMDLWGINLHFDLQSPDMVEFDSIINIRPRQGNSSRGLEDSTLQEAVMKIVGELVQ